MPGILVKAIDYEWRTKNEMYLFAGHAGPQFVDHVLGQEIALLDRNLVRTEGVRFAARQHKQCTA